ncbi:hypothetical protein D3C75_513220 [compost metagenome]
MERRRHSKAVVLLFGSGHIPVIRERREGCREKNLAAEALSHLLQQMGRVKIEQLQADIAAPHLRVGNIAFIIGFERTQHILHGKEDIQEPLPLFLRISGCRKQGRRRQQLGLCLQRKGFKQFRQLLGIGAPLSLSVFTAGFAQSYEKGIDCLSRSTERLVYTLILTL